VTTPVVRTDDELIADEHGYLFVSSTADLASPAWSQAACRDAYPEAFFPISERDVANREHALTYCRACVIRTDCLRVAMRDKSIQGIWGGTDERDRAALRKQWGWTTSPSQGPADIVEHH
jgi:WhiB family transcriptional regulator, redox-sensing transcriptional regulator